MISREIRRNRCASGQYRAATANKLATARRARAQDRKIDADEVLSARVRADLKASRTPRQIAGRLRLEAGEDTVEVMDHSPGAQGRTVSYEAIRNASRQTARETGSMPQIGMPAKRGSAGGDSNAFADVG